MAATCRIQTFDMQHDVVVVVLIVLGVDLTLVQSLVGVSNVVYNEPPFGRSLVVLH